NSTPQHLKTRATLNCIDKRGKQRDKKTGELDKHCSGQSNREKLSTIFVDNCVHSLYKAAVSWFFESLFCFAIKKCAPIFYSEIIYLYSYPAWRRGFPGDRLSF